MSVNASQFDRLVNVILRATTLATRFLFIIFLAKFVDPATVGYYGLFTATVGYAMLFAGLDFYTYATREIVRAPAGARGGMLKAQAILITGLYVAFLPVALLVLTGLGWPPVLLWWFAPILMLEHLNQEISRLLIALSEQITASLVLFLRQGSWAIAMVALMAFVPESRRLQMLFPAWGLAGLAAAALGGWKLWRLDLGGWNLPINWAWVRKGITVSLGFLVATLALRATQTVDRYWLEAMGGVEIVAAYVLYFGIAGAMMVFLDAGVFAFAYPALILLHHEKDHAQAARLLRSVLIQTLGVSAGFAVVSWLVLPYLIAWIGNPVYEAEAGLYPLILVAMIINAIAMVPHYGLYARGVDRPIILAHFAGLAAFVVATWGLSVWLGSRAVPVGVALSFLVILVWKSAAYLQISRATRR